MERTGQGLREGGAGISGSGSPGGSPPHAPTQPPGPALQPGGHSGQPSSSYATHTPRSSAPAQAAATHRGLKSELGPLGLGLAPSLQDDGNFWKQLSEDSSSSPSSGLPPV